ncbi:MAG: tRNA (adenosine(37)-N6)-dimethylallyltransferase MiaA [Desulfobacteraceae bacterium]|nr:tRNA (adenosine(37)-N6)-dimethylallyltransferase MiaA [Desulfobacteraceae bacterium]
MKKKIIVICGPTGIGKTGFAIHLARKFDTEIVGGDSVQIYRHMEIGSAKPDAGERAMARHHLVDIVDPDEDFDAARFAGMADRVIEDLHKQGKTAIVAGGTGFYLKALLHGLFRGRAADPEVVARLEAEAADGADLHGRLQGQDPESAARIHPNDLFRVVRALEVVETTGRPISSFQQDHGFEDERYLSLKFGLYMDREKLYQRIEKRVDIMLEQGLIDEVRGLLDKGYSPDLKAMQTIGYRHACDYLSGKVSYEETVRLLKRDTRRYAKRQFTWFRRQKDMVWLEPGETERAENLVTEFLG